MSVLLETSVGDIVLDLYTKQCPNTCKNFLKLCKVKYYNNCLFFNVQENYIIQSGDPTNSGTGGTSMYGILYGDQARYFDDEIVPNMSHTYGKLCMASSGKNMNASQFYIVTSKYPLTTLDEKHTIFGEIGEGHDAVSKINSAYCDDNSRPLQNISIRHVHVLDDPFPDPPALISRIPPRSPSPAAEFLESDAHHLGESEDVNAEQGRDEAEVALERKRKEAASRAVVLEMIGDLPSADVAPPENILFVCKLNQVTTEEDLELIFSRFGEIVACDIIKDYKTGQSLQYAFISFKERKSCENAYFKMDNALIDDRRIHVDFSQSVAGLWRKNAAFLGRKKKKNDE